MRLKITTSMARQISASRIKTNLAHRALTLALEARTPILFTRLPRVSKGGFLETKVVVK